jgi:hypothetical protein
VVVAAAAQQAAIANHGCAAEVVVDLPLLIGGGEGSADQNAASSGDVGKETVLDAVATRAALNIASKSSADGIVNPAW